MTPSRAPYAIEEIPAYIEQATPFEKRVAGYLVQVGEVCRAAGPGEVPGIPKLLQRKRSEG
jgi:hypothetical protein